MNSTIFSAIVKHINGF